jgi:hypothetical protein
MWTCQFYPDAEDPNIGYCVVQKEGISYSERIKVPGGIPEFAANAKASYDKQVADIQAKASAASLILEALNGKDGI